MRLSTRSTGRPWQCCCPMIPTGTGATVCMNACMHACMYACMHVAVLLPYDSHWGYNKKKQDSTRANAAVQHPLDQACTCTPVCMNVWMYRQAFVVVLTVLRLMLSVYIRAGVRGGTLSTASSCCPRPFTINTACSSTRCSTFS